MAESFFIAVNAVIPFFCYLALGYGAKCLGKVDTPFLDRLTKLIFSIMFPFMTFNNIYAASRDAIPSRMLLLFVGLAILAVEGLGLWLVPKLIRENSRRGVLIQALYRSNFVLFGIPLTATLYGADQTSIAAMLAAEVLTIYNITSVIILELFNSQGEKIRPKALVGKLLRNPMLQGCCVGLVFFFLGIRLPKCLESPISSFANMTTPLAMFALGAPWSLTPCGATSGCFCTPWRRSSCWSPWSWWDWAMPWACGESSSFWWWRSSAPRWPPAPTLWP